MWIWIIALSICSGVLYRLGGAGAGSYPNLPAWMKNTKARDIGCSLCCTIGMLILCSAPWWAHLLSFLFLFGALTTYWDWVFGYDNHYFHGFMCGVAYFPYALAGESWIGLLVRCVVLATVMGVISQVSGNDVVEEGSRGAALPLTLPLIFI